MIPPHTSAGHSSGHSDSSDPSRPSVPSPSSDPSPGTGTSRRALLRTAAALGAAFTLSSLPQFSRPAYAADRPPSPALVPGEEAVALWYGTPGDESSIMEQGLPVGNGRLGALTTQNASHDALYLADVTLWSGGTNDTLGPDGQFPYEPDTFGSFGQLARLYLDIPGHTASAVSDYRRTLDLSNGLAVTTYTVGTASYRREVYASHPDDVLVIRLTQTGGSCTGELSLAGTRGEETSADAGAAETWFTAALANGLGYAALLKAVGVGGTVSASGNRVTFEDCSEVNLVVSAGTNYAPDASAGFKDASLDPLRVARAKAASAAATPGRRLLATHVADHQRLQQAMSVDLGPSTDEQRGMDTAARLAAAAGTDAAPDPELEAAYLQFGRYLMICGSRDSLPVNLQGPWIDRNDPAWMSDYHSDINVQMNYWLPDRAGLSACFDAFTDYCLAQQPVWEKTTQKHFQDPRNTFRNTSEKLAGWTLAFSTNIFGGNGWRWHPAGNAWLCNSLYEHYQYTGDTKHLEKIYPLLKGACEFWEARLVEVTVADPGTGRERRVLVDDHDWSPEHGPQDARGITYAQELLWQLFGNYGAAADELGRDAAFARTVAGLRSRLHLPGVSSTTGWLKEWMSEENLGEKEHRHLSPLVGLFPGDRITVEDSPAELLDGVRKLLTARGMESYGWACAWRAMCWARLGDAEKAYRLVRTVMRPSVDHGNGSGINMFDMYRLSGSASVFQIDANFGTPVAMIEMLAQSRPGHVELLPALPDAWAEAGRVTGIGLRGGLRLDLAWARGAFTEATLHGAAGARVTVVAEGRRREATLPHGGVVTLRP
ncbi:glycoside hydrolase family 95 protein [Streptomyces diacarni]|uniref:glycoside hydrolase family 95 protein n=1 Tax=Streptomyces diacarni TaxID=2800381 RepID=UPI0033F1ECE2